MAPHYKHPPQLLLDMVDPLAVVIGLSLDSRMPSSQAETSLERFHHCTEIELLTYVDGEFLEFGKKLFHLTSACEIQGQRRTRTGKKSLFSTITAYKPITLLLEKLGYDGVVVREWSRSALDEGRDEAAKIGGAGNSPNGWNIDHDNGQEGLV
ncbi:hypothetical protein Tco_0154841 [Tanacetum coccineum]